MRVLRVHAHGADPRLAVAVGDAIRAFNASLDIRLRFLSIGIEDVVMETTDAARAASDVALLAASGSDRASGTSGADLTVVIGGGEAGVAAAAASIRAGVPVVCVGAGARAGPGADLSRALDRLCTMLLPYTEAAAATLRDEAVQGEIEVVGDAGDPGTGGRIVRALTRARRRERC